MNKKLISRLTCQISTYLNKFVFSSIQNKFTCIPASDFSPSFINNRKKNLSKHIIKTIDSPHNLKINVFTIDIDYNFQLVFFKLLIITLKNILSQKGEKSYDK